MVQEPPCLSRYHNLPVWSAPLSASVCAALNDQIWPARTGLNWINMDWAMNGQLHLSFHSFEIFYPQCRLSVTAWGSELHILQVLITGYYMCLTFADADLIELDQSRLNWFELDHDVLCFILSWPQIISMFSLCSQVTEEVIYCCWFWLTWTGTN